MSHFHVCNKLKSIFLVALSVAILTCSIPFTSFRSQALEAISSEALTQMIGYLMGYTASRGYDISKNLHFNKDLFDETLSYDVKYQFLQSYFNMLEAVSVSYSNELKSALNRASKTGVFSISEDLDTWLSNYYESITVDDSLVLGTSNLRFEPYSESETVDIGITYIDTQLANSPIYSVSTVIDLDYDYLPLISYDHNDDGTISYITFIFLPTVAITSWDAITSHLSNSSISNINSGSSYSLEFYRGSINNDNYYLFVRYFIDNRFPFQSFNHGDYLTGDSSTLSPLIPSIYANLLHDGYYDSTSSFVSNRIHDTSNEDILSSASEIDLTTGEKTGGFTMYMRDWSLYQQLLRQFSDNMISWNTLIKQLGLSSISKTASVEQKEAAQQKVAYPDSTYDWFSSTTWGSDTISDTVTNELTDAQLQEGSIADELVDEYANNDPDYEDPDEEKNKGGLAMLLATALLYLSLWDDPNTDPTSPDSGGIAGDPEDQDTVPWLQDTLRAIPVVAGLESSIFQSAGGSNGYGFIYTVGVSFVLFSVIIGAGHFLGGLGNHAEVQAQKEDKEVVRATHRNNLALSELRLEKARNKYGGK